MYTTNLLSFLEETIIFYFVKLYYNEVYQG